MKTFIICFLFICCYFSEAQLTNWSILNSDNVGRIKSINKLDSNLFILDESSLFTKPKGNKYWTKKTITSNPVISNFKILSNGTMVVIGSGGVHFSNDTGKNWTKTTDSRLKSNIEDLFISKKDYIFITSKDDYVDRIRLYYSKDYGETWQEINSQPFLGKIYDLVVNSKNEIFIFSDSTGVWKTTDFGLNWKLMKHQFIGNRIFHLNFNNKDDLLISCSSYKYNMDSLGIRILRNNTDSLEVIPGFDNLFVEKIVQDSESNYYVATNNGIYKLSNDFKIINKTFESNGIFSIDILASNEIYAFGNYKYFITKDSGKTWSEFFSPNANLDYKTYYSFLDLPNGGLLAGTGSNGIFRSIDHSSSWAIVMNDNRNNKITNLISKSSNEYYASIDKFGISQSLDSGWTWKTIDSSFKDIRINNFILLNNTFITGTSKGLFYSSDCKTWNRYKSLDSNEVTSIFKINDSECATTTLNKIFYTPDKFQSLNEITLNFPDSITITSSAVNSKGDIFVGTLGSGMFRKKNNENQWKQININLKDLNINSILIIDGNLLMVTTSSGIFYSNNDGDTWSFNFSYLTNYNINILFRSKTGKLYTYNDDGILVNDTIRTEYLDHKNDWLDKGGYFENATVTTTYIQLKFDEDGTKFYTYNTDNYFQIWETFTGKLIYEKKIIFPGFKSLDITKDGKYLVVSALSWPQGSYCSVYKYDIYRDSVLSFIYQDTIKPKDDTYIKGIIGQLSANNNDIFISEITSTYVPPPPIQRNSEYGYNYIFDFYNNTLKSKLKDGLLVSSSFSNDASKYAYSVNYEKSYSRRTFTDCYLNDSLILNNTDYDLYFGQFSSNNKILSWFVTDPKKYYLFDTEKYSVFSVIPLNNDEHTRYSSDLPLGSVISNDNNFLIYSVNKRINDTTKTVIKFHQIDANIVTDSIITNDYVSSWIMIHSQNENKIITASYDGVLRLYDYNTKVRTLITRFFSDTTKAMLNTPIHFSDTSYGKPNKWYWDFGDGNTSNEQNPTHVYTTLGLFSVKLITSNDIISDTLIKKNYIKISPIIKSLFKSSTKSGVAPLTVQFKDLSLGNLTSWKWDFGDSTSSDQRNPIHIYEKEGIFNVKLTVSDTNLYSISSDSGYTIKRTPINDLIIGFERDFNFDTSYIWKGLNGFECLDGGFIILGEVYRFTNQYQTKYTVYSQLIKINEFGDTLWTKRFSSNQLGNKRIIQTSDSGFIINDLTRDSSDNISIRKFDKNGLLLWEKSYGTVANEVSSYIESTLDGGFIISIYTLYNHYNFFGNCITIKCDKDGNQQSFGLNPSNGGPIVNTSDGGYLYVSNFSYDYSLSLVKLDKDCRLKWSINLYNTYFSAGKQILETIDTTYLVLGSYSSSPKYAFIFMFDKNGNKLWKNVSEDNPSSYNDIIKYLNTYIVAGSFKDILGFRLFTPYDTSFIKYEYPNRKGSLNSIVKTRDGGLFAVGTIIPPFQSSKIYALKINKLIGVEVDTSYKAVVLDVQNHEVRITLPNQNEKSLNMKVYSYIGSVIYDLPIRYETSQVVLNTSSLLNGVYLISYNAGDKVYFYKFIVY